MDHGRKELFAEAFVDKVSVYTDLAEAALENPDVAAGFADFLDGVIQMQLIDRGFADVLTDDLSAHDAL